MGVSSCWLSEARGVFSRQNYTALRQNFTTQGRPVLLPFPEKIGLPGIAR